MSRIYIRRVSYGIVTQGKGRAGNAKYPLTALLNPHYRFPHIY